MIFISSKISDGNMSFDSDSPTEALENRKRFFKNLGINLKNVAEVKQAHGNKVIIIDKIPNPETEADGLITNKAEVYLMMKIADCMAIGFYDPKHHVIGIAHVGWQGLEKEIIKEMVENMKDNFDTNPKELFIQISPSIGPCHYRLDIWTKAEKQLISCGILKENFDNPKICTYESKEYFSHRRSEDQNLPEYRFVTILGLK